MVEEGFFGRWSRRKQALRAGQPVEEPALLSTPPQTAAASLPMPELAPAPDQTQTQTAAPSLQDVAGLTQDSDFRPFVARSAAPEVRNAALKKLFADPHYNVMDGLDVYIDDYSLPDPLPHHLLRQMVSAKFLNVLDDSTPSAQASPNAQPVAAQAGAQAAALAPQTDFVPTPLPEPQPETSPQPSTSHDHFDLRLQSNHAAEPAGFGRRAE